MLKKSLFFGAAALALLVLLAFAGCSNPASDDGGGAAPQLASEFDYPAGTVFTSSIDELRGLLNNPSSVDTNDVTHIAFANGTSLTSGLTIPTGKTVYLNGGNLTLTTANIIVESGARLVLVGPSTRVLTTANTGKLLVKGTVEIYGTLAVAAAAGNHPAMQVADYYEADGTIDARDTVIGTSRVLVGPGGTLRLTADDIANQYTPNRFTPPQAWAAAGQGSLVITGTGPAALTPSYTVRYLLEGIGLPSGDRTYTVETQGGGVLPSVIPAGAIITTTGVIEDADNQTLTVNGSLTATNTTATFEDIKTLTVNGNLIANFASFESVETLKISSRDSDNLPSRASTATTLPWATFTDVAYLAADRATLKNAKTIIIGDYGEFASESTAIELPEGATISLGRSSAFRSAGTTSNSYETLERLFIGPASDVTIASPAVTFNALKELTLQDSASLTANTGGNSVNFLVEATPSNPPLKTKISWGLNTTFSVGMSPIAKVDLVLNDNSSLLAGGITLNEGGTLTVAADKTLTVGTGTSVNFANLGTTAPASTEAAPVKIDGTLVVAGGTISGPNPGAFATAPTDIYKFIAFGPDGKIVVNYGGTYEFGAVTIGSPGTTHPAVGFIGSTGTDIYQWAGSNDGARITISAGGITIEDTDGGAAAAAVTSNAAYVPATPNPYIFIQKEQTLYLGTNVQLKAVTNTGVYFAGEATTGGAQLKGPGALLAGAATITGGASGWRVFGADAIGITQTGAGAASIVIAGSGTTTSLRALGTGAVITQGAVASNDLTIDTAVVDLAGTATSPGGSIVLTAGTNPAKLVFAGTTIGKVQLGTGTGTVLGTLGTTTTIGGKVIVLSSSAPIFGANSFFVLDGKLTQLGGAGPTGAFITASTTANNDVTIVSNAAFSSL
jgi:hypothetical protein